MKFRINVILIIIFMLAQTGCWNNRDLTDIAIMAGIAIDKAENGKVEMTVQVVKPEAIKPAGEGGGKESRAYVNVSSQGETMLDAARNLLSKLNKKAYFAQVQLIIISEEVAREGLSRYFDLFERDTETRRRADLVIAKGMKAKTVLESESRLTKLPATHNVEALETSKTYGKSLKVTLIDVLKNLNKQAYCIVLPVLYNSRQSEKVYQEELIMEGSAIIKADKLIGFLEPLETRGFLFAKDEIKSTIINIPSPLGNEKKVSIEIVRSKGRIFSKVANGKPILGIEVKAEGNIGEQQENEDLTSDDDIEVLEKLVQGEISREIEGTLKVTQKIYKSDIFGFIDELYKNYYSEWTNVVSNWCDVYSDTPVNVEVQFNIRRPGLIKKPTEQK